MTFGNLVGRPDLRPLFGALSSQENDELLDRLLAIDARLTRLAERATAHVGVPYRALGLRLAIRTDGTAVGIHGGASGDAGDIWFDISPSWDQASGRWVAPPWIVESALVVFCSDSPEPGDEANTHDLLRLGASAHTPMAVLEVLESHVSTMTAEIERHPHEVVTNTPHALWP